ncbi:MAG: hypothetical protein AAF821_00800 [Cyanobacteria bacterium P01_D01_bin.156]
MAISVEKQLEQYTIQHPREVLLVTIEINGEADEIMIFRGFSSSLTRSTSFDPDVPVLPDDATIVRINRLASPYNPNRPQYLEPPIAWDVFAQRLAD